MFMYVLKKNEYSIYSLFFFCQTPTSCWLQLDTHDQQALICPFFLHAGEIQTSPLLVTVQEDKALKPALSPCIET